MFELFLVVSIRLFPHLLLLEEHQTSFFQLFLFLLKRLPHRLLLLLKLQFVLNSKLKFIFKNKFSTSGTYIQFRFSETSDFFFHLLVKNSFHFILHLFQPQFGIFLFLFQLLKRISNSAFKMFSNYFGNVVFFLVDNSVTCWWAWPYRP